jgi:hypothetical protein
MSQKGESRLTDEQLLAYYEEVCRSHAAITDFRAKLLALLPIASGAGIGLLWSQADGRANIPALLLIAAGLFGASVTVGLFFYEFHQMDDCQQLRNHGVWIERELGIEAGQFGSKRGKLGLRHIWPSKYKERDKKFRGRELDGTEPSEYRERDKEPGEPERDGTEPSDDYAPGWINVRNADCIVYGAVFLAWVTVFGWGLAEA